MELRLSKRRSIALLAAFLFASASLAIAAPPADAGSVYEYAVIDGCSYTSIAGSGFGSGTTTDDNNNGCAYLKAYLHHSCDNFQTILLEYAVTYTRDTVSANRLCGHYESMSKAADSEYGHWGSTGWWG